MKRYIFLLFCLITISYTVQAALEQDLVKLSQSLDQLGTMLSQAKPSRRPLPTPPPTTPPTKLKPAPQPEPEPVVVKKSKTELEASLKTLMPEYDAKTISDENLEALKKNLIAYFDIIIDEAEKNSVVEFDQLTADSAILTFLKKVMSTDEYKELKSDIEFSGYSGAKDRIKKEVETLVKPS